MLVRGGKSRATVKVKMKRLAVEQEEEEEKEESRRKLVLLEEEVREEDWLLASLSIDASLFLLTAHNKLLVRGKERKEVCASSGPCILYRYNILSSKSAWKEELITRLQRTAHPYLHPAPGSWRHCSRCSATLASNNWPPDSLPQGRWFAC